MPLSLSPDELFDLLTCDVIAAIANCPGEPDARRAARAEAARRQILAFAPRDGVEIMFASQAAMFEALTADAAKDLARAPNPDAARRIRQQIMGMGRLQQTAARQILTHRKELARTEKAAKKAAEEAKAPPSKIVEPAPEPHREPAPDVGRQDVGRQDVRRQPVSQPPPAPAAMPAPLAASAVHLRPNGAAPFAAAAMAGT